jgi:ferredoxin
MMEKGIAHVSYSTCMACGICVGACPFGCLLLDKIGIDSLNKAYPELKPNHGCTGCSLCAKACPVDCISIFS